MAEPRTMPRSVMLALLVPAYVAAGRFGLLLAFANENASPVWAPTGLAIAALLLVGIRAWPAVAFGAFIVNLINSGSIPAAMVIAVGNTLEAVAGAWLTNRFARGRAVFDSTGDVMRFVVIAAGASAIAASIGAATVIVGGLGTQTDPGSIWLTWWLGDTVGAIVVAPIIVLWERRPRLFEIVHRLPELLALLATLALAAYAVFSPWPAGRPDFPVLVVPVLLWCAFRFGAWFTALSTSMVAMMAIYGTLRGWGPFGQWNLNDALLLLQAFIGISTTMMLSVAAEVSRRRIVEQELRRLNDDLEWSITTRTDELVKVNERLIEAQEVAHVGSWEWDISSDRIWWSDEMYRIYGIERAAPIGYEAFLGRLHPDDRPRVEATVRQAMADGRPFEFEHRVMRRDGTVRMLHGAGRVIVNSSWQPIRMVGIGLDITERKEAEEARAQLIQEQVRRQEAEESSRAKDQFLAILSHELRTPLNAALGWAHMLREMPRDSPATRNAVDTIYRNLLVQSRLVSDIVDVSRISKGALTIEPAPIDLAGIINAAMEMVREPARVRRITLESRVDGELMVELIGDAKRLEQVFWNLLSNGVRFGREGGIVSVSAALDGESVRVTVEDDGPGIDPEFLPFVFEPFRQADASPRRAHDGLGLGLAIARHLVELHGGSVSAANRSSGGAQLTVVLPARSVMTT